MLRKEATTFSLHQHTKIYIQNIFYLLICFGTKNSPEAYKDQNVVLDETPCMMDNYTVPDIHLFRQVQHEKNK